MIYVPNLRNTATDAVKQELLFVGQESGKLLAVRNLVRKVRLRHMVIMAVLNRSISIVTCHIIYTYYYIDFLDLVSVRQVRHVHNWSTHSTVIN